MKKLLGAIGILLFLALLFWIFNAYIYREKERDEGVNFDYKNSSYFIDGQLITLKDGVSEIPAAPGSATMITTRYFGNAVEADLDKDGDTDTAFLVTHNTGGSGTFYYLVGAIKEVSGYRGTSGVLIGDRIAPQTTEYRNGNVIVNYADRERGEPMTAEPSVAESLHLRYNPTTNDFGEIVPEFEGEADPSVMKLNMKTWVWIETLYNDERVVKPKQPQAFTLEFLEFGRFGATTDCNQMAGNYTLGADDAVVFDGAISTKRYCEGSQEGEFAKLLENTSHYKFTSRGELILDFKSNGGTAIFR
ncbi:MAG: META domain-containing protein [Candidatus Ryanbacteria bacterium]|nr:META domain-containing protein [Candidatus Ryanbacteria bacterium]